MAKEKAIYTEPEEKSNTTETTGTINTDAKIPDQDKDPLTEEEMRQRPHAQSGAPSTNQPMPEFTIDPSKVKAPEEGPSPGNVTDGSGQGAEDEPEMPSYEEMKKQQEKMSPAEEKEAALFTATFIVDTYGEGWRQLGNYVMPVREKTIENLVKEKAIDLSTPVYYEGRTVSMARIIEVFNDTSHDKLGMDQKTKDKIIPIIADELAKRGIAMPPMVYVAIVLVQHAAGQVKIMVKGMRKKDELIDALKATTAAYYSGRGPGAGPTYSAPEPERPQPTTPHTEPVYQAPQPAPAEPLQEETTGLYNPIEKTQRMYRNINKQNRAAAQRAAEQSSQKAPRKRGTYKKNKNKKVIPISQPGV